MYGGGGARRVDDENEADRGGENLEVYRPDVDLGGGGDAGAQLVANRLEAVGMGNASGGQVEGVGRGKALEEGALAGGALVGGCIGRGASEARDLSIATASQHVAPRRSSPRGF